MPELRDDVATLREKLAAGHIAPKDRGFAEDLLRAYDRWGVNLTAGRVKWIGILANNTPKPQREKIDIGKIDGVIDLFDKAAKHKTCPAVVLVVGYADEKETEPVLAKVYRAGPDTVAPGTLNVVDHDVEPSTWYGRVLLDGNFELSPRLNDDDKANAKFIVNKLREFTCDPIGVATQFGRITQRCCFCYRRLDTPESKTAGYGPTCAENFGLEWGAVEDDFAFATKPAPKVRVARPTRKIRLENA